MQQNVWSSGAQSIRSILSGFPLFSSPARRPENLAAIAPPTPPESPVGRSSFSENASVPNCVTLREEPKTSSVPPPQKKSPAAKHCHRLVYWRCH